MKIIKLLYQKVFVVIVGVFVLSFGGAQENTVTRFNNLPVIKPFFDDYWMLVEDLSFEINGGEIIVPEGFVTDLASIPDFAKSVYDKFGRYAPAGIVHDYLYWTQVCTKDEADEILRDALKSIGVGFGARNSIRRAVDKFGKKAWKENIKWKEDGFPRIIPQEKRNYPIGVKWKDYAKGLRDSITTNDSQTPVERADYCEFTD